MEQKRVQEGERATLVGALVNLFLAIGKVIGGVLASSAALVADGVHSLADLISDGLVLVLYKHANRRPDHNHPWGHARFETLGSMAVAVILAAIGLLILWQSTERLVAGEPPVLPGWLALAIAAISLLAKEALYQYTMVVARRHDSRLLAANAWHHRTDMFTSGLVLIAIMGAMLGWWWLDAIGAAVVSLLLLWLAGKMLFDSLAEFVDTALPQEEVDALIALGSSIPGVLNIHDVKTRRAGPKTLVELHIQVPARMTAAEAHHVGHQVLQILRREREDLAELIYHIDVEPPGDGVKPDPELPQPETVRAAVKTVLLQHISTAREEEMGVEEIDLYMFRQDIQVEIKCAPGCRFTTAQQHSIATAIEQQFTEVSRVRFWHSDLNPDDPT